MQLGVSRHPNIDVVLRNIARLLGVGYRAHRDPVRLALADDHCKHVSPALGSLLAVVLQAHGWGVSLEHLSVHYTSETRCGCARFGRGGFCPLVAALCRMWPERSPGATPPDEEAQALHERQLADRRQALTLMETAMGPIWRQEGLPF